MKKALCIAALALLLPTCGKSDIPVESKDSQISKEKKEEFLDAVRYGKLETAEKMLHEGIDVNSRNCYGQTILHQVALRPRPGILEVLLKAGADLNARDNNERTPLHYAALRDQPGIIEWLISHGADTGLQDGEGSTPLDYAHENMNNKSYEVLRKHNAPSSDPTFNIAVALYWNDRERALELLSNGADPNVVTNQYETPLIFATRNGDLEMVRKLIEYGATADFLCPLFFALSYK